MATQVGTAVTRVMLEFQVEELESLAVQAVRDGESLMADALNQYNAAAKLTRENRERLVRVRALLADVRSMR